MGLTDNSKAFYFQDENNALRLQVEDLSGRLRSMEIMFARVKDELARYRTAAGRTPFPNLDEEQRLKSKLQVPFLPREGTGTR